MAVPGRGQDRGRTTTSRAGVPVSRLGRDNHFDAVLTVSNEITASADESPIAVDGRKLKRVALHHLSWWRVLTEAIVQSRHRGVSDPDQAWLLGELIAYLDHERSGAGGFQGMGDSWVTVRTAASNETLRAADPGAKDIAERWDEFVDYLCLGLGQDLGRDITPVRARKHTASARREATARSLAETGRLEAAVKVPDAVGNLTVDADLRTRRVTTSVDVDAPRDGRPKTRVGWMLRQLKNAPDDLRIEVRFTNARETSSLLLDEARDAPERLLSSVNPTREPRSFRIALTRKMGTKRGKEDGSFVRETRKQAIDFYRDIVQDLRAWQPPAPKLPPERMPEPGPPATPDPPPFTAPDERDPGEGTDLTPEGQ
jgi:hypothetical protein